MLINNQKHIEKSKCFFHAQRGEVFVRYKSCGKINIEQ
nr:MAG TPA: hypothetical protein [Caudoviricetes sp.]